MDWEALIDRHGDALLLFARRWSRCQAEAEDSVQDGFMRFWRMYDRHPVPDEAVPGHLFLQVKRAALDRLRSDSRRRDREALARELDGDATPMFESAPGCEDERIQAEKALNRLPDAQREVVVMKVWGGLTFLQIGHALGISLNTAASRYRLALATLREELGKGIHDAE